MYSSSSVGPPAAGSSGYMMQVTQQWLPLMFQHLPQSHTQQLPPEEHLPLAPPTALQIVKVTMYSWNLVGILYYDAKHIDHP